MQRTLEKHLEHMRKPDWYATPAQPVPQPPSFVQSGSSNHLGINMTHIAASQSLKKDSSPGNSPASSWHSPSQIAGQSPIGNPQDSYMHPLRSSGQYQMAPAGPPSHVYASPTPAIGGPIGVPRAGQGAHRRVISDMSGGQDDAMDPKRQRMYPTSQSGFPQQR